MELAPDLEYDQAMNYLVAWNGDVQTTYEWFQNQKYADGVRTGSIVPDRNAAEEDFGHLGNLVGEGAQLR